MSNLEKLLPDSKINTWRFNLTFSQCEIVISDEQAMPNIVQSLLRIKNTSAVCYCAGLKAYKLGKARKDIILSVGGTKLAQTEWRAPIKFDPKKDSSLGPWFIHRKIHAIFVGDCIYLFKNVKCMYVLQESTIFPTLDARCEYGWTSIYRERPRPKLHLLSTLDWCALAWCSLDYATPLKFSVGDIYHLMLCQMPVNCVNVWEPYQIQRPEEAHIANANCSFDIQIS